MELEKTDQEQVEELQKWWRENRLALVGGLVLGIGALVGWEQWQDSRGESAMAASQSYTAVERAAQGEDAEAAQAAMRELEQAHPGSVYLVHGYSALAAQAAQAEDWPAAVEALQQALAVGRVVEAAQHEGGDLALRQSHQRLGVLVENGVDRRFTGCPGVGHGDETKAWNRRRLLFPLNMVNSTVLIIFMLYFLKNSNRK